MEEEYMKNEIIIHGKPIYMRLIPLITIYQNCFLIIKKQ